MSERVMIHDFTLGKGKDALPLVNHTLHSIAYKVQQHDIFL